LGISLGIFWFRDWRRKKKTDVKGQAA
jgi:hypothetical protein